jgi:hypothetical protein
MRGSRDDDAVLRGRRRRLEIRPEVIREARDSADGFAVWPDAVGAAQFDVTDAGMLTTASDLLFTGGREGYFHALDAKTGKELWKANLGGSIVMAPITYRIDGQQEGPVDGGLIGRRRTVVPLRQNVESVTSRRWWGSPSRSSSRHATDGS